MHTILMNIALGMSSLAIALLALGNLLEWLGDRAPQRLLYAVCLGLNSAFVLQAAILGKF